MKSVTCMNALRLSLILILISCACTAQGPASGAPTADKLEGFAAAVFTSRSGEKLPYRLFVPAAYDAKQKYPLLLWLHGAGGLGDDNPLQISQGNSFSTRLWTSDVVQKEHPSFVLAPQCPQGAAWTSGESGAPSPYLEAALRLLADLQKKYSIDSSRIYVAGQSMGGTGTWSLLAFHPELFAAGIPVAPGFSPAKAKSIATVPVWVFTGENDPLVPVASVRALVEALRKEGGHVLYTEYPGAEHVIWDSVFAEPELPKWLFAQRRRSLAR
jgi:predicted peptidase